MNSCTTAGHTSTSSKGGSTVSGPYLRNSPCVSQHQPSRGRSVEGFHSGPQLLLTTIFWTRVFRALSSQSGSVALRDGSTLLSTGPSSLCSLLQSAPSLPVGSFPGSLDPLFRAWSQGSLTRALIRDLSDSMDVGNLLDAHSSPFSPLDGRSPLREVCALWSSSLPSRSSVPSATTGCTKTPLAPQGQRESRDGNGRPSLCSSGQQRADASPRCKVVRRGRGGGSCCFVHLSVFECSPAQMRTSPCHVVACFPRPTRRAQVNTWRGSVRYADGGTGQGLVVTSGVVADRETLRKVLIATTTKSQCNNTVCPEAEKRW